MATPLSLKLAMMSAECGDGSAHRLAQKVLATLSSATVQRKHIVHAVGSSNESSGASEASLDHEGISPLVRFRGPRPVGAFQGSGLGAARDPHRHVRSLPPWVTRCSSASPHCARSTYSRRQKRDTATNEDCEFLKSFDFFVPQNIREDAPIIVAATRGLRNQGMSPCRGRTRIQGQERAGGDGRHVRVSAGSQKLVCRECGAVQRVFLRPQRSLETQAVPRDV